MIGLDKIVLRNLKLSFLHNFRGHSCSVSPTSWF